MIKNIKLENYKIFSKIKIDFSAIKQIKTEFKDYDKNGILNLTAITGGNAAGKTVFLKAISEYFDFLSGSKTYDDMLEQFLKEEKIFFERKRFKESWKYNEEDELGINDELEETSLKAATIQVNRHFNSIFKDFAKPIKMSHEYVTEHGDRMLGSVTIQKLSNSFVVNRLVEIRLGEEVFLYKNEEINEALLNGEISAEFIVEDISYFSVSDPVLLSQHTEINSEYSRKIIKEAIKIIEKDCIGIRFNEFSEISELEMKFPGQNDVTLINYHHSSAGTRKFLNVLNMFINGAENRMLLMFDEFESYLHPDLTRWLVNMIRDGFFPNLQVIISTHNPEFLDELRKDQIYLLKNKEAYRATEIGIRQDKKFSNSYKSTRIADGPNELQFFEILGLLNK